MLSSIIRETIDATGMIAPGDRVLVAFSGGPDSTALLYALAAMAPELEITIFAAHFNHLLRGDASNADERWCAETADSLKIDFISERADVLAKSKRLKKNLEEVAREMRYTFLYSAADRFEADRIAIGHNADDQAETVLLRLLRGAGSGGLGGMRAIRGRIIRPMLNVSRKQVIQYLKEKDIPFRLDLSNEDERFSRVFLRKQVIPLLERINPGFAGTLGTTARVLGAEADFLAEMGESIAKEIVSTDSLNNLYLDLESFASLHIALQRHLLRRIVLRLTGSLRGIGFGLLEAIRLYALGEGPAAELPGFTMRTDKAKLVFTEASTKPEPGYRYQLSVGNTVRVKEVDKLFTLRIIEASSGVDFKSLSGSARVFLDADIAGPILEIRNWRHGDRYKPIGAPGHQKLHDLFINSKIKRSLRSRLPVFLSQGRICWVSGFRIAEEFQVTERTNRILIIEEENDAEIER